jgi:IS4 transposase
MVSRAISKGFIPQYGRIDVLGLMKGGRKVAIFNTDILPKIFESKIKTCRRMKCRYLAINVVYKGTPIKVFFIMMNGQTSWKLLITTDERLSFIKAMEYYQIRWTIEVFFREAKQDLHLGKCQSNVFDALIAPMSLSFMHYIVLVLGKRFDSYETMGEIFRAFKDRQTS